MKSPLLDDTMDDMEEKPKPKRGRPPGVYKWGEPTITKTHRMTKTGHDWILENKEDIEKKAHREKKKRLKN